MDGESNFLTDHSILHILRLKKVEKVCLLKKIKW